MVTALKNNGIVLVCLQGLLFSALTAQGDKGKGRRCRAQFFQGEIQQFFQDGV